MNKLFSCLYGSKLYGTSTPTSDIDWKHIVLPELNDLLLCKKIENKVKKTNVEKNVRNSADDVDEEFIPLQVFARHFVEGQTYAIELAFAIDGHHALQTVYDHPRGIVSIVDGKQKLHINGDPAHWLSTPYFVDFVQELRTKFLTSNIKTMMGYVVNQASLYSFKGERLNATCELIEIMNTVSMNYNSEQYEDFTLNNAWNSHVKFQEDIEDLAIKYPKYFRKDVYDVGGGVMKLCFVILEKTLPFTNSLSQTFKVLHALKSKYGSRVDQASESNVDWKATMHALRIVDEGIELLSTKKIALPFNQEYVDRLLSIKRGELPLDPIKEELSSKLDQLKDLEKATDLPTCNAEFLKEFDIWLTGWLRKFYDL
jgi:hypothetical protein